MGLQISDGKGSGHQVKVDSENRLSVASIESSVEHYINHKDGKAYNCLFEQAPTAGDDCILYLYNSSDFDMVIEGITTAVSQACELYFQLNDQGTRNAATELTPVNLNVGSGNKAEGTFEKGADLDGGAATLTGGIEFDRLKFTAATDSNHYNFEQDIIVPKGFTMTIWCDTAATNILGTIVFNYHNLI